MVQPQRLACQVAVFVDLFVACWAVTCGCLSSVEDGVEAAGVSVEDGVEAAGVSVEDGVEAAGVFVGGWVVRILPAAVCPLWRMV